MLHHVAAAKPGNPFRIYANFKQLYRGSVKIFLCAVVFFIAPHFSANAQIAGVGAGQTYATLNDAITAINTGALTGSIQLQIRSSSTLSGTAVLNASGTGAASYSSIRIYPTGNYAVTANINGPLLELVGCANVTIDGRLNTVGATYNLTLENMNTGANAAVIRMRDGGSNNIVQNAIIKGAGGSATRGLFTADGAGNMVNIVLQYCRITNSNGNRPYSSFYVNAAGATSSAIFFGNEVYDLFRSDAGTRAVVFTGTLSAGYIMNNHFYETTPVNAISANTYRAVSVEGNNATNVLVQGNFIGGSQVNAGGSAMTFTSASAPQFDAIYISGGTSAAPASVQNNTITNISFQSAKNNLNNIYSPGYFNAIYISGSGVCANIGTVAGNTIGSQTVTGAIQLFPTNTTEYCPAVMIFNDADGTVDIQNNTMGGINSTGPALAKSFTGILNVAAGNTTISNNIIGSVTTAGSINIGPNSDNAPVNELVWGIANLGLGGNKIISGNTIANITQQAVGPNVNTLKHTAGIFLLAGGDVTVDNNVIHHLKSLSNTVVGGEFSSVVGIDVFQNIGSINSISGNRIYELECLNTENLATEVTGIFFKGNNVSSVIRNNFIHGLRLSSSSTAAKINGINIGVSNGIAELSNNVVALGAGITNGYAINGILDGSQEPGNANKFYYNTISISGDMGPGSNSSALYLGSNLPSGRAVINNILVNERNNMMGTASHYGLFVTGTPVLTVNYNDYYTPNSGGVAGYYSGNRTSLPVITGQDANSVIRDPGFVTAGGTNATGYIPANMLAGTVLAGYEPDHIGVVRPASPFMGAFHYLSTLPVAWLDFKLYPSKDRIVLKWSTANEQLSRDFVVQHSVNGVHWKQIGIVAAAGTTSLTSLYQYTDLSPSKTRNYYRILQRDINGKSDYSVIRTVEFGQSAALQLFNNPVTRGLLEFQTKQAAELFLVAPDGRLIWRKQFSAGQHQVSVHALSPGVYYLKSATEVIPFVKK
ncbi:beta strand repeat-containing protein [Pseudobacter ginsenosidimutans]|nr:hypothetical protein [Pseudobacter ginsenosidimutans]QEC43843.1 hypothetical protein FSB84_19965 [Pseudobacter ginsenosidimutans]